MSSGQYYVYIMTGQSERLYVGVTNDLVRRIYEHKNKLTPGFTSRYGLTCLVYHETTSDITSAISREKELKGWIRERKIALIESCNPGWMDLARDWHEE